MGLQYSKSDATSAETSLPALPEDVIERIVSFITDTSHLQALSLASQAFNAHVKRLCPICIPLPCRDPKQTAEAVRRQARDPQGTCLRICAAWPSAPAATISRQEAARRVALCHTQCCIVLGRPVVQAALQHITTLELKGLWLHEFVPPWLSLFSPSLTILTLTDCHIPEFKSTPTASPHIQTLQITRLTDSIPPESANVGILKHAVTAQLLALPNVRNVTIDWQQRALVENGGVPVSDIVRPPLHATLRCVDIPNWVLRDQDMEIFLAMPALHEIGYQYSALSTDFSERACEWTQVTLSDLRSGDLPLMPLRQVQRLCLRSRPLEQPPAAVTRPAAQRAAAMQVWLQWAYNTPPALAAGAQILNNIPEVIVIPPLGWKWPNDSGTDTDTAARMGVQPAAHTGAQTEVIFTCGREWGGTDSLALHQTTLLAIWPAIARGLENTPAHTLTVQLRNIDTCTAALVSALTQRLTTTSPPSVLSRLRLEMCHTWVSAFDKFTDGLPERLLHADVTHGLPLVFTLCPDSTIYDVRLALKNAPRGHGGTRAPRVTLQLLPRVIPESSRGIEVIYGALAAEAGVEFECVCVGEEGGDGQDGVWGGQWWGWAQESLSYVYKLFGY